MNLKSGQGTAAILRIPLMVFLKGYMVLNTCLEGGKGRKEEFETKEENFPLMIKKKYPPNVNS